MPKRFLFRDDNHVASFVLFFVLKEKKRIIVENTAKGGSTCTVHLLTALSLLIASLTNTAVYAVVLTMYTVNFLPALT